eukprot:13746-Heterococcus_DN1.PRE.2
MTSESDHCKKHCGVMHYVVHYDNIPAIVGKEVTGVAVEGAAVTGLAVVGAAVTVLCTHSSSSRSK